MVTNTANATATNANPSTSSADLTVSIPTNVPGGVQVNQPQLAGRPSGAGRRRFSA